MASKDMNVSSKQACYVISNQQNTRLIEKLLSYFVPVTLKRYHSRINGLLEINLVNGKKVLDTSSTNYSYGSLQRILHRGLIEIKFDDSVNQVLALGLGGGSIVQTIRNDFKSTAHITLVDIDPTIIFIAINEFDIVNYGHITVIQSDAFSYIRNSQNLFDVIVVDIFINDRIPTMFTEPPFIRELIKHLTPGGKIIFNIMRNTLPQGTFSEVLAEFTTNGMKVIVLEKIEYTNSLILAEKVSQN